MKRILVLAVVAFAFSVFAAQTATSAGPSDAHGPPCSNITNRDAGYGDGTRLPDGEISVTVFLQSPACSFVTYSFFVTDTSGNLLATSNALDSTDSTNPACAPDVVGGGCVHFTIELGSTGPSTVCMYATTDIHGHVADLAPNASDPSCPASSPSVSLAKGSGGASGGFN